MVPSRVPAPLNITEIGGYLNLLTGMNETAMRSQVLAGILGVAGPVNAAGWVPVVPPDSPRLILNDRPAGNIQASIPVAVPIRGDYVWAILHAIGLLHDQGCMLPLLAQPRMLPTSVANPAAQVDPLPYLGRVLTLAAGAALVDPSTDALVLARNSGSTDPFQVAANSINPATAPVRPANYEALAANGAGVQIVTLTGARLVNVNPILGAAGFFPTSPLPQPASPSDALWARYTNLSGLVPGQTRLADELGLLYTWTDISSSIFSGWTNYVWDGSQFAPS